MAKAKSQGATRATPARRVTTAAGRPIKLGKKERREFQAVRQRPALQERLSARVKRDTKRLEPMRDVTVKSALTSGLTFIGQLRQAILPNDPADKAQREKSGESVVAFVGAVDLYMLVVFGLLLVIGPVMVYSASMAFAALNQLSPSYFFFRQVEWLGVGAAGMYVAIRTDYHRWRLFAGPALVVSVVTLLLLRSHGVDSGGATRWLKLGPLEIQPSEIAKVSLVLYSAHWFANQKDSLRQSVRGLIPFAAVVGGLSFIVIKQPDLGTGSVILFSILTVYFVSGARLIHLVILAVAVYFVAKFYLHQMHGYQLLRLQAFQNPYHDPQGAGFQNVQMINALGSGGWTGSGLGQGHSKYAMPEAYNDSIFAVLGEEWGVVGTLFVISLFCVLALRGLRASALAPDMFGRLLAAGLTCSIVFQALINIAGVADLVPFTGVPLPFISYGGSALSIAMVSAGILLNISKQAVRVREGRDSASSYLWWWHWRSFVSLPGRRKSPKSVVLEPRRQRPASNGRRAPTGIRSASR